MRLFQSTQPLQVFIRENGMVQLDQPRVARVVGQDVVHTQVDQRRHDDDDQMEALHGAVGVDGPGVSEGRQGHEDEAQQGPEPRLVSVADVVAEDDDQDDAIEVVENYRAHEKAYIVLPNGFEAEFLTTSTGNGTNIIDSLKYHNMFLLYFDRNHQALCYHKQRFGECRRLLYRNK